MTTQAMSRRAALGNGLALTLASPVAALAASSAPDHPDAELASLWTRLESLRARQAIAEALCTKTHDAAEAMVPPLPEVLRYTNRDRALGIPAPTDPRSPGIYTTFNRLELEQCDGSVMDLVPFERARKNGLPGMGHIGVYNFEYRRFVSRKPSREAKARLAELKAALTNWQQAKEGALDQAGHSAANADYEAISAQITDLLDEIAATPAKSINGVVVKVLAVKSIYPDEPVAFGEACDELLAASIIRDMLKLAPALPATA